MSVRTGQNVSGENPISQANTDVTTSPLPGLYGMSPVFQVAQAGELSTSTSTSTSTQVVQVDTQQQQSAGEDGGTTECTVTPTADSLVSTVRSYHASNKHRPSYNQNWYRVLIAFGAESHATLTPFTASEAQAEELTWTGWTPFCNELARLQE